MTDKERELLVTLAKLVVPDEPKAFSDSQENYWIWQLWNDIEDEHRANELRPKLEGGT